MCKMAIIMKRLLIIALCGLAAFYSCKCSGGKQAEENNSETDTFYSAIDRYMAEEIGSQYSPGEYSIPFSVVVATDESDPENILVWGDFWVDNYDQEGDTLKCVSGGSHPGLMHVSKTDNGYEVVKFDAVADGSGFLPSAKEIFGEHYDDFIAADGDDDARKAAREASIANYVEQNQLAVTLYQDYGWDAESILK